MYSDLNLIPLRSDLHQHSSSFSVRHIHNKVRANLIAHVLDYKSSHSHTHTHTLPHLSLLTLLPVGVRFLQNVPVKRLGAWNWQSAPWLQAELCRCYCGTLVPRLQGIILNWLCVRKRRWEFELILLACSGKKVGHACCCHGLELMRLKKAASCKLRWKLNCKFFSKTTSMSQMFNTFKTWHFRDRSEYQYSSI